MIPSRALAATAMTFYAGGLAFAQVIPSDIPALGGVAQAMAETCGDFTAAQLRAKRDQQKAMASQIGIPSATFDAEFDRAYEDARAKLATMSKPAIAKACDPLKATPAQD